MRPSQKDRQIARSRKLACTGGWGIKKSPEWNMAHQSEKGREKLRELVRNLVRVHRAIINQTRDNREKNNFEKDEVHFGL